MNNIKSDKLINIFKYTILSFFGLIILYLLIISFNTTALITFYFPFWEKTVYEQDNMVYHLIFFLIFTIALIYLKKLKINPKIINFKRIYIILFVFLTFFILITNFTPKADQAKILNIADNMYNQNFSDFEKDGYIGFYPHQKGLVLFVFLLRSILGNYNYHAFQIINVIMYIIYFYCMVNITKLLFKDNLSKYLTLFLILFFPIALYVTFVYGNLLGLSFSLLSILYLLKYYIENKKIVYIILSSMFISLAIIFKQNSLIFFIAIIIYLFFNFLKNMNIKSIVFIILFIVMQLLSSFCVNKFISNYTGIEAYSGVPSASFVAMGIQPNSTGWYNGYNYNTFSESNYDTEIAKEKSIENIKETLNNFSNDLSSTFNFLSEKINSQWNEPSFQGFWVGQTSAIINNQTNLSPLINNIYFGKTNVIITDILNILQTLILIGTLLFIIFEYKNIKLKHLIFAITFIGGFTFHLFWEAKSQYTISYFVLLIPYTAKGYNILTDKLITIGENYKTKKTLPKINKFYVIVALVCIILTIFNAYSSPEIYFTEKNDTMYEEYMSKLEKTSLISHGKYSIIPKISSNYFVNIENKDSNKPVLKITNDKNLEAPEFLFTPQKNLYKIKDVILKKDFDVTGGNNGPKNSLSLYAENNSNAQTFEIIPCEENSDYYYIIWNKDYAITLSKNTNILYIDKFSKTDNQKWKFVSKK